MEQNKNLSGVMETREHSKNEASLKKCANKARFSSVFVAMFFLLSVKTIAQSYSGGVGTEAMPYLISTKLDMVTLANAVNNGDNYSGNYFLLTQDLVGTGNVVTTTIGFLNSFNGTFDGGGYEIEINNSPGVFGTLNGATIKNLGVRGNANIDLSTSNGAGGIAANALNSTLTNCWNRSVVSSKISGGGICGRASNCTLTDCYNLGNINTLSTGSCAGGICGVAEGSTTCIFKCYNQGSVSATTTSTSTTGNFPTSGGICGYSFQATISDCYNTGNISGSISEASSSTGNNYSARVGGICGYGGTIEYCYNIGNVIAHTGVSNNNTKCYAGGICGEGTTIKNCIAANTMIKSFYVYYNVTYNGTAGRINGRTTGATINNCYALSSMLLNGSTTSTSNIYGQHGGTEIISSFQSQDWIEAYLFWDFDQIWEMPETGFPIFKVVRNIIPPTLSNLTVSAGTLVPSFSSETLDYTVVVDNNVSSITLTATANDLKATVSGDIGLQKLEMETNLFTITVIAEDGVTKLNYTVKVILPAIPPSFVPVTSIRNVPIVIKPQTSRILINTVEPRDATNKEIVWTIKDVGTTGATITDGNLLSVTSNGPVILTATIANGLGEGEDYTKDFEIRVVSDYTEIAIDKGEYIINNYTPCGNITCGNETLYYRYNADNEKATVIWNGGELEPATAANIDWANIAAVVGYFFPKTKIETQNVTNVFISTNFQDLSEVTYVNFRHYDNGILLGETINEILATGSVTTNEYDRIWNVTLTVQSQIDSLKNQLIDANQRISELENQLEDCEEDKVKLQTLLDECLDGGAMDTKSLRSVSQPTIHPNPVKNELNIESNGLTIYKIEIVDLSGKTIYQFDKLTNQINISALSQGVYFVKLEIDEGIVTEKFIKE